jgi:hypothetical protein
MRFTVLNLALLVFGFVASLAQSPSSNSPAVVYQSRGALFIATSSGRILKALKTLPAIGTFAISRDAQQIAFASLGKTPNSYGGQLYLLVPPKTAATRLTHGPYYNKSAGSSEVYSNPDFSPDGKQVVFSVHSQSTGDVVEAAGPFATIDLKSRKVALLNATLHVPGEAWGTAYADSAYWSPDGSHILLNFEDGFALTDPSGKLFENLSSLTTGDDWTSSVGWLGSQCIVYVGGEDYPDSQKRPAKVLNLKTRKTALLNEVLGLSEQQTTGLVAISGSMRVRRQDGRLSVETSNGRWSIQDADRKSSVRLVPSISEVGIPEQCR